MADVRLLEQQFLVDLLVFFAPVGFRFALGLGLAFTTGLGRGLRIAAATDTL